MVAFSATGTADYVVHGPIAGDNPAPAIDALAHGDLSRVAADQPLMGLVSIILRAPFALLVRLVGGGEVTTYRLGALACLLPAALLVAWLVRAGRSGPRAWLFTGLAAIVILAGPATSSALATGHPEELLASALAVGAVLVAGRGGAGWAGLLLGLAIGTKEWAVIGVVPMLVALSVGRPRALLVAAVVAVVTTVPAPLANPHAFASASHSVGASHFVNATSIWWPVGSGASVHPGSSVRAPVRRLPLHLDRSTASLLLLALAMTLAAAACLRRGPTRAPDPFALFALMGLARCAIDPLALQYYYVPVLLGLVVWERKGLDRPPVATFVTAALVAATFGIGLGTAPDTLNALWLAWSLALAAYLVRHTFSNTAPLGARRTHVEV